MTLLGIPRSVLLQLKEWLLMYWQSSQQLQDVLYKLVGWESETHTQGEKEFPKKLQQLLMNLAYFQDNPQQLQVVETEDDRALVSALYQAEHATKTVVLISHFDTVSTEEYGALQGVATQPDLLAEAFLQHLELLNDEARADLKKGDYVFGRGAMDMKMGLVLHMHLLEKAIIEQWPTNILLITVPDEEVNSLGMRTAVKHIAELKRQYNFDIELFLNSEPSFPQEPGDLNEYLYTGSIGKVMPAALFYGKETHAGEPLKGITASYMNSFLTTAMEWNTDFLEAVYDESTPLPVSLEQKDLKIQYSTQTPYRSYALYNVFLMQNTVTDVFETFKKVANQAMQKCQKHYFAICEKVGTVPLGEINVLSYEELYEYSLNKLGATKIAVIVDSVLSNGALDDRKKSIAIADQLMIHSHELAPATVLMFAPPYYPAVSSKENPVVQQIVTLLLDQAKKYEIPLKEKHYFNGICDLSYCQKVSQAGWQAYEKNTPVWNKTYSIPFEEMAEISAPVLNVGPFGKDAHQISERLHKKSAFEEMPELLTEIMVWINQRSLASEGLS